MCVCVGTTAERRHEPAASWRNDGAAAALVHPRMVPGGGACGGTADAALLACSAARRCQHVMQAGGVGGGWPGPRAPVSLAPHPCQHSCTACIAFSPNVNKGRCRGIRGAVWHVMLTRCAPECLPAAGGAPLAGALVRPAALPPCPFVRVFGACVSLVFCPSARPTVPCVWTVGCLMLCSILHGAGVPLRQLARLWRLSRDAIPATAWRPACV